MKKGFTLIELLAVIAVLGIISLITVPTIAKTIENARQESVLRSAESYISGINSYILSNISTSAAVNNKILTKVDLQNYGLDYKGVLPDDNSKICISDNKVVHYILYIRSYTVIDGTLFTSNADNYKDYVDLANYLFDLESKLFSDSNMQSYLTTPLTIGTYTPGSLTYYADGGKLVNYAITANVGSTTLALTDGHIGLKSGYIDIYTDTARILAYLNSNATSMTDGEHTLSTSPVEGVTFSKSGTYDVVNDEIIDYSFHFSKTESSVVTNYVNNSGQIKVE